MGPKIYMMPHAHGRVSRMEFLLKIQRLQRLCPLKRCYTEIDIACIGHIYDKAALQMLRR